MLSADSAVKIGYRDEQFGREPYNCFTVLRAKFDRWFAEKAEEVGVLLVTETLVESLLIEDDKVVGVRTGRPEGEVYADVVVAADGVNSFLAQEAGLRSELTPGEVAVAVKEIIALPKETIQERFKLQDDQGIAIELVGEATGGMVGTGFIYTNRDSLSVGVGVMLTDLVKTGVCPADLIERLKEHPVIRPLLAGGETREYLAHMIPEGGYNVMPKLYRTGMLVIGDAAMLVNSLHREGSNLAMASGKLAAETIIDAREKQDYSEATLAHYRELLESSFVIKDLKKYRNLPKFMEAHHEFFTLYPKLANEVFRELITVGGLPKKEKQDIAWKKIKSKRSLWNLAKDIYGAWRALK